MKRWLLIQKILAIIVIINIFILLMLRFFHPFPPTSLEGAIFIIFVCLSILLLIYSTYKIKSLYPNYYRSHYRSRTFRLGVFAFIFLWTMIIVTALLMALFLSMRLYNIALAIGFVNMIILGLGFCIFLYYMFIKKQ